MTDPTVLKRAMERNAKAISLRPSIANGTSVTRATIVDGTTCEVTEGPWRLITDVPKSEGGENKGPTPGVLGRGALGSCLAIGIVMHAAAHDVALEAVSVEVQADWDGRGYLGLSDVVPAGYSQLRVTVDIRSSAPEPSVREIVRLAEQLSPYVDVFRRGNDVIVDTHVRPAKVL